MFNIDNIEATIDLDNLDKCSKEFVMEVGKDHAKGRIEELAESGGRCLEDVAMIVGMDVNLDHENHGSDNDGTIQC